MRDAGSRRIVRIVAPDDALAAAIAEHRGPRAGWRVATLDPSGGVEPQAMVIVDIADDDAAERAVAELRQGGFAGPVLVLGGETMRRPVRLGALLARIDAHAQEPAGAGIIMLGLYEFLPESRALAPRGGGEPVRLTELEDRLIACLAEAGGALVGRDDLLARVWGYAEDADTHTVETHIWRLRQKIETDDPDSRFLVTESGGYRLEISNPACPADRGASTVGSARQGRDLSA